MSATLDGRPASNRGERFGKFLTRVRAGMAAATEALAVLSDERGGFLVPPELARALFAPWRVLPLTHGRAWRRALRTLRRQHGITER